jgi:hypothetical protein
MALLMAVPVVLFSSALLYHWYDKPVPTALTEKAVRAPFWQTVWAGVIWLLMAVTRLTVYAPETALVALQAVPVTTQ